MKKLLLLTFLSVAFATNAQKSTEDENIYTTVETNPTFTGGVAALFKFICGNIHFPASNGSNKIEGYKVFVRIVVEKDGSISNPQIMNDFDKTFNKEALRVINLLPKWQAGGMKKYGVWQPLRVYYTVPIAFFQNKTDCEKSYSQSLRGY